MWHADIILKNTNHNDSILVRSIFNITSIWSSPPPPTKTTTITKAYPSTMIWSCELNKVQSSNIEYKDDTIRINLENTIYFINNFTQKYNF